MVKVKLEKCIICHRNFANDDYDDIKNICSKCEGQTDDCRQCHGYLDVEVNQCEYCSYGEGWK